MNKQRLHNTRENKIKTCFEAIFYSSWGFSSVSTIIQATAVTLVAISLLLISSVGKAESENANKKNFGTEQTTNIFPTKITTDSWGNVENSLSQDLPDYALYQEFNDRNSGVFGKTTQAEDGSAAVVEVDAAPSLDASVPGEPEGSTVPDDTQAEVPAELPTEEGTPASEPPAEPAAEETSFRSVSSYFSLVKLRAATTLYPLAQLSLTSSTDALPSDTSSAESVVISEVATTTPAVVDEEVYDMELTNFDGASLNQGQFVDSMQLRMSFGARLKTMPQEGMVPYVEVLFGSESEGMQSVGSIILDEEVSNAINGGYYLFPLPSFIPAEELEETKVILRYHGDNQLIEGMYLDAVWLEVNTKVITEEDLKERGLPEALTHLETPKTSVLLSDQLNFDRTEAPVFNLRYESQQNFFVRSFLKLIGRSGLTVSAISVNHQSIGNIPIEPNVTIAGDGLVTIELPKNDIDVLRPGTYNIAIEFEENGVAYTDTFEFEWGVLSINPNKTEYEVGEEGLISLGALSENGNTLCDAHLDLYVTDPTGFITKLPVTPSGACNGNNVIDVPDYTAPLPITAEGEYVLYLERLDENGNLVGYTRDTVRAVSNQPISIERNGPTRIYPPASYPMTLTVATDETFEGVLTERVPASFVVSSTTANITQDGDWQVLSWDVSIHGAGNQSFSYGFDAPDISPYLYNLGEASLVTDVSVTEDITKEILVETGTTTEGVPTFATSTVTEQITSSEQGTIFKEHRQWQIASDATGSMILMWDGATIPTGWTCISCTAGDQFYQRYIIGSSTPGTAGGATTHTHTASGAVNATGNTVSVGAGGANNYASAAHTHTYTPTIGTANNLPLYRNLVVIQNNSAGEPTSIPAGAIAVFDATVPSGWTQYSAQNGYYVRGESTANRGTTGGSNTHTHTITGTTGASAGTANDNTGGGTSIANSAHTHTVSSSTAAENSQPPYIEAILGKLSATSTMPNDAITMWSDTAPTDWNAVSTTSTAFSSRFLKASGTYGTTGGASVHTPANVTGIVSSGASAGTNRGGAGNTRTTTAHTHTVNVTAFTSGNILPQYRSTIFAKRAGGQPPAAPTIHELFDHEKTGTSTPEFEFTANDPVGTDSLIYEFAWDDDSDVGTSPLGDRTSDVETGCSPNCFSNTVSGGDTSPFNEAERIRFTMQSSLTDGTTYYYRVRAKKSTGSTWGDWSQTYSFTYVSETDPSQWMQTEDAQFSKGVFSNTETFGSNSVRIVVATTTEAIVAYGEGVVTTPRYQVWGGTSWGGELSAQDVGGVVQWLRLKAGTKRDEYIMGTHDGNNDVNVQIYNGTANTWGNLVEVTAAANNTNRRAFDVAYESTSGDAMIVYCSGTNAAYRLWNGTSWATSSVTITTASTNNCEYIALASDPTSDEIIMVTRDTAAGTTDYEALVWDGSTWANSLSLGSMTDTNNEGIAVEYEESGGDGMVIVSNGATNGFLWASWLGTEWTTPTPKTLGDDFQWGVLKRDQGSDSMALCYIDTDADIGYVRWSGESWQSGYQELETTGNADTGRAVSCEFEVTSGRDGYIMVPYSDDTNARWRAWQTTSTTTEASISTIQDSWEIGTTRTGDGKILAYFHDDVNTQYDFSYWNGTIWSTIQTLEGTVSVNADPRLQPIGIVSKIFEPTSGTFTSPIVDFDSVPNRPTWGEVTWTATEPAGTDVTIQVLYATSSVCNVPVPNGTLPGNSAGFTAADMPVNISGLSTSTYNNLCLKATLTSEGASAPTLDDWNISWERQPYLVQTAFRWYANRNNENPNDAWPSGATDLLQNETIPQAYSPGSGDVLRLRMLARSDNAALPADEQAFKLQFSESASCASSTLWYDVGEVGSTTAAWRGYNNLLAFDGSTISTLLLTGADVGGTYEEENDSDTNPNTISVGNEAEWDWVLEQNTATDGVQYCFRMVADDGVELDEYTQYPSVTTNASPVAPTLEKLFDNEQVASTSPWFEFVTEDAENDDVTYQIQVDNNNDFSSTALDRNSATNLSEFENIVTLADKDAFTTGQTIRFKPTSALSNATTYYWRVRAKDGSGSNEWGDWSTIQSFTVDTGTTITTWYQTEQEQFDTDSLIDTETTGSDDVVITTGPTTGTTTGTTIDFDSRTTGNAWGALSWNHNVTSGSIRYRIEYLNDGEWELVPDTYLPSNSTGFTSSPVSLLGLDPQVHNQIRVRANFTYTGGTPRLLDWKIEWGNAVEQPTLISLFDNEKTGTTTPTFTFTTSDPESNDIQYEFAWSTDQTFTTGVTVATSGVSAGFANVDTGADTSPFFSGDTISYKRSAAFTNGTTYWWKVRGRDPAGGNAWSVWSESRSFTVDTTINVSTWFQTTDEQFETDSLNSIETTGSDSVEIASTIREAFTAYAEGTVQTPRYRIWNGSTWGDEETGTSVGGSIRFIEVGAAHSRNEYIIATQESSGRVRAQVYDGDTETTGDLQTIISAVPSLTSRGFDVAYEQSSGDALVVACNGTEATYYVWNGTTWTGPTAITLSIGSNCNWIQLASDPASDEIIMVAREATVAAGTDYEAFVWDGSAWANNTSFGVASETNNEGIAIEYEESGDRAVVVVPNNAAASFTWNAWTGGGWVGATTVALQDDFENGRLARDLGSDNMVLCSIDQDGQIAYIRWNGTTNGWTTPYATVDTLGNSKVGRPFACQYETTSGRDGYIMMPYSDTAAAQYRVFDGTFPGEVAISTIQDSFEVRSTRTGDGNILALFYDDINTQYDFSYWNGTIWSTVQTIEATAITTTNPVTVPLDIVSRVYPTFTTGTVYSSPIVFSEGSGLKWQQATFSDTTPGASDILYQVEYWDGDSYELIPNTALPGNSTGFSTSPIDLSAVSRITYSTIRLRANLSCSGGNCPTLNDWTVTWAEGIVVSGTIKQYNQTASTTSGTVAVAVNGAIQAGKTAVISNGTWSISNVRVFEGDIVTAFVTGASDAAEAVAVARYDGDGDISGMTMFERHLVLGSNDATTTAMTNADIGLYDFTSTEDIFFNGNGSTLSMCATTGCSDAKLYVKSNVRYVPGGRFVTHDFQNYGYFTAGSFTHEVNGSWDNNATSTMTGSTIVFAATSTTESIDSTGATVSAFNNVTMGTTTGNATWTLGSTLDVDGALTVSRGTLSRGTTPISIGGTLTNGSNGLWAGIGTTTFDGGTAANWSDLNSTLQNIGKVVVDGTSKAVTLASNVAAQSINIGANDTLDAAVTGFDITVYGNWYNQNNFVARTGEVFFAATSTSKTITTTGDSFYDLTFSGSGGGWSFTESTVNVGNDMRMTAGTVTLPTATTTVAGSFITTSGTFQHNNAAIAFTSSAAETITFAGGAFTNVAYNLYFNGTGNWTVTDTYATSTNDVVVQQGTLNFSAGTFAIGGRLADTGGTYNSGTGTVRFYSASAEVLTAGGSSYNNVTFAGAGSWSFTDTNVTALGNVTVNQGTLTLPSGTFTMSGSYDNNATVTPGTGTVLFNATATGKTVDFGSSALYNVTFNSGSGGWTVSEHATTSNNFTLTAVNSFTLASSKVLAVGNVFTNSVGGAATTWTGSTLSLTAGTYSLNTKVNTGDAYETIRVAANTKISMWNSSAVAYNINATGYLYSQDHNAVDGDLYIFGAYTRTSGTEYWNRAVDFDGTSLGVAARQVDVRFASGASAVFSGSTLNITGSSSASTTIANQGSGTYTVSVTGGTFTAGYYQFGDLGGAGLSLLGAVSVPTMQHGSFTVGGAGGSAITLSSTTINASPSKQIFNVHFATSTAIAAYNVSQTDGTPTSFWWFRDGTGNLYGEAKDNDTGNPGSVRFDDSSLVITVEGTVYSDSGVTPIIGGTCDGSTAVVRVVVSGGASYTGSCSNLDGTYSIPGVTFTGDPTLTVYLDNASGGQKGSVVSRTPTGDIADMDIYANRVIVRNEDVDASNIANFAVYDYDNDTDLRFTATTAGTDALTVMAGNELYVFASTTFTPAGVVTLAGNAAANSYDGTLYIANGATMNAYATSTLTVGGRFVLGSSATFNPASTTVIMNATTSGKSVTSSGTISFNNLTFNGSGGTWNIGAALAVAGDMTVAAGTVTGTSNITLSNGSLSGNGTLSLGAGTTTIARSNTLGGTSAWTFYNLQLGNGTNVGTTTPVSTATTTISGRLTIANAHFLDGNATTWDLAGTGTVFVETGTFLEDTTTVRYSGAGSNVRSTSYYNLDINSGAGSQAYTATGLGIVVLNNLTVGGTSNSTFNVTSSDPALDVNGSVTIRSNGTFSASDTATFTIGGSFTNTGTFTGNNGTVTFDGSGTTGITPGSSSFSTVDVRSTGAVTVSDNATSTGNWMLRNAGSFTVASGKTLAVSGTFYNALGGGATTWTGSTLSLSGNGNYSINAATTTDTYGTLRVNGTTQIRTWNTDAASYSVNSTASLYSQDHANVAGDLYIYGSYRRTTGGDYWSYAYDFDGSALGGGARKVDVFLASGASVAVTGGSLLVEGASTASTTLQNQGSGSYGITIGGNASTSWRYYEVTDANASGLVLTSTARVNSLSFGSFGVSQNAGTAITVGGTVITQNPAKNFTKNNFYLDGVGSGFNVTATGTSISAWRFANHYGDIDGEGFDVDPNGDPGYVAWDDSAALITVSGYVYSDEGSTVSGVCDGFTNNVTLRVAGITSYSTTCDAGTGEYVINNVSYGSADMLVVYIDGEAEKGATVTQDPLSNINDLSIYENRVIARHESTDPLTIDDMATWDSSDDADIPYTAVSGSPDTLTLPANRKLIVWGSKTFAPGGNVTLSGGGGGAAYDGTLELFSNADWTGAGTDALSVGGSLILNTGADFVTANGTTTFTTSGAGRTIDLNEDALHHVAFTGSGSWTITDATFTANGNVSQSAGTLDLPTGTSTFNGSFINNGGTFDANGGLAYFTGTGGKTLKMGGSNLATTTFSGGNYTMSDANATSTGSVTIESGTITFPSSSYAVGGSLRNLGGAITHNNSRVALTSATTATLLASSSNLYTINFRGGGTYTMADTGITFVDDFIVSGGSSVTLASGTIAVGGSLTATGGTFTNTTTTFLFNSADTGETINPGSNNFYAVQIGAPTGGYTLTGSATTTHNFTIASAQSFATQSGVTLKVLGVFTNSVGGTNTSWNGSTLALYGSQTFSLNTKSAGADRYNILNIGPNTDVRMWNSSATTTSINTTSSLYSQDHNAVNGALNIYGDFHIASSTEYWSYAKDFDGTSLSGSERAVTVYHASNATTTVDGGGLEIIGTAGNETTITNQGSGTFAFAVSAGTLNALYYEFRNLNATGLHLTGTPTISSLSYGDFELAVNNGSLITLASSTLNANASKVIMGARFATTSAITGKNVTLSGTTANAWTFVSHTGNLDGEAFDVDGGTACGSIRWSDSSCLITQQTHYRWRNDDGNGGVPNTEWYNASWDARKAVRIDNADATTYSNAVVQMFVTFDADMQADFDDLRFTDDDGTTALPFWIGSSTASTMAEVWVKVPSLAAEDAATVYMYYNNPTATASSSMEDTFIAADDFEDGDFTEYSGQTTLFAVDGSFAFDGAYGLDNTGDETSRATTGGIYRLDQTVSQGETFRFMQYIDTASGSGDEVCTKFGVQNPGTANDNYAVCIEQYGVDRISLVKDVVENESSGTVLATSTVSYSTGWYEIEVEWGTDDSLNVGLYDAAGTLVTSLSDTDSSYTSGGIGFTYWYHYGGWDSVGSRPTLATEPTVRFGAEQGDGGASWKAAQDTSANYDIGDIARLRVAIENSGLLISGQQMLLEYAALGAAPSCEAVDPNDFVAVPVQASCGTSPVCMQSTTYYTNGAASGDHLFGTAGLFTPGQLREDPSNMTSSSTLAQDTYTEIEYAITPTSNTVDENLCFRVTNNGTEYDTYLRVAQLSLQFDPFIDTPLLNEGNPISLLPGTTTRVYATTTVTDLNGPGDLRMATSTFYRSGVAGGASCAADNNNCYISQCSFTNCVGNSCVLSCYADIYFHADPTDIAPYEGEGWYAFLEVEDYAGGYDFDTTQIEELYSLPAIDVANGISYGSLAPTDNTGSNNASTSVANQGNLEINIQVQGTDMTDGYNSEIPASEQKFSTTTFTYGACVSCVSLSSTTAYELDVDLAKPTTVSPPVEDRVYWGVQVPYGTNSTPHQGVNVFTPVAE
ncbi:MAG: hypothetical protein RLZZ480_92 [Candidatus Parcubacteria bacterium]